MTTSANSLLSPPPYFPDTEAWKRQMSLWALKAHQGHLACTGSFTCSSGTAQTVLTDSRIGYTTFLGFMPKTANASTENLYVSSQSRGGATVVHANAGSGDRQFTYAILG